MKVKRICGNCCYFMENNYGYHCVHEFVTDEYVTNPYHSACVCFDPVENPDFSEKTEDKTEDK